MSNVLICYYSIAGNSKYQDLADAISDNNNNVMQCNLQNFRAGFDEVVKRVLSFKPDLIFSYNNCLPEALFTALDCPILVVDADNPEFMWHTELLKKNKKNIYYLCYQSKSKEIYKKILNIDIDDKNSIYFPPASNFKNDPKIKPLINILFIGSSFALESKPSISNLSDQKIRRYIDISRKIKDNYFATFGDDDTDLIAEIRHMTVAQHRLSYLCCLSDLGLKIYSNSDWKRQLLQINLEIADCHQDEKILTKKQNLTIYNSSKVAINISHLQASTSFSWRVPDIMSSNACLVMEDKVDWHELFGKYISQDVKDAIIYKDQYDMRAKCINLLNDEELRLKCVKELNFAVEKVGRWEHRMKDIGDLTGVSLFNNNSVEKANTNIAIMPLANVAGKVQDFECGAEDHFQVGKKISTFKMLRYTILIFLYQFNFLRGVISKKKITKTVDKIVRYLGV